MRNIIFKKMRNKLLLTNMLIISLLVISILTGIFVVTIHNVDRDIDGRLSRSVDMCIERAQRKFPEREFPERVPTPKGGVRRDRFSGDFAVYTDRDGKIILSSMGFDIGEDYYRDSLPEIIDLGKENGSIVLDVDSWAYKCTEYGEGYIIAFAQNSAQRHMLIMLGVILALFALLSLASAFAISLYVANRSIKPVEESYNKQKQFVADASHELKTPLAAISANADVLSENIGADSESRKWLTYIKDETDRMTKLTNDLLLLAKSDFERDDAVYSEVSLSGAVLDVMLINEVTAFEKGIDFKYDIEDDITVKASQGGLKQLIIILTDNALKYTPRGGYINIMLRKDGGNAVLTVSNSGEGIAEEDIDKIFDRFYRTDKSRARNSGGYGLGLAIAKSLCKSFGGRISVKSTPGIETEFKVTLPAI